MQGNTRQTVFVLGATGGCTNAALTKVLQSNMYNAVALVRTPEKLTKQLKELQSLDDDSLSRLETVSGNATDPTAMKAALTQIVEKTGSLPSLIISGLGASPRMQFSLTQPIAIDQPTLCEDGARTLVDSLRALFDLNPGLGSNKPDLVFVSTTGISRGAEDVPYGMRTLYHTALAMPHEDKKKMENVFRDTAKLADGSNMFASVTALRPTLLASTGAVKDAEMSKVKVGTESEPAQGWQIKREDVGAWMWENVIRPGATQPNGKSWKGEMISMTRGGKQ